ncbi:hypothetical protein CYY_010003, partial [Polysphondylium violaceum]
MNISSSSSRWENTFTFNCSYEGKVLKAIIDPGSAVSLVNLNLFKSAKKVDYEHKLINLKSPLFPKPLPSFRTAKFDLLIESSGGKSFRVHTRAAIVEYGHDLIIGRDFLDINQCRLVISPDECSLSVCANAVYAKSGRKTKLPFSVKVHRTIPIVSTDDSSSFVKAPETSVAESEMDGTPSPTASFIQGPPMLDASPNKELEELVNENSNSINQSIVNAAHSVSTVESTVPSRISSLLLKKVPSRKVVEPVMLAPSVNGITLVLPEEESQTLTKSMRVPNPSVAPVTAAVEFPILKVDERIELESLLPDREVSKARTIVSTPLITDKSVSSVSNKSGSFIVNGSTHAVSTLPSVSSNFKVKNSIQSSDSHPVKSQGSNISTVESKVPSAPLVAPFPKEDSSNSRNDYDESSSMVADTGCGSDIAYDVTRPNVVDRVGGFDSDEELCPNVINNPDTDVNDVISQELIDIVRVEIKNEYADRLVEEFPYFEPEDKGIYNMKIETIQGAEPFVHDYGRRHPDVVAKLKAAANKLLAAGVIEKSISDYCSPVFFVRMPGKDDRMVVDFTKLNKLTVDFVQPMPRIDEIFDSLGGSSFISVIDAKSGFHHLLLDPDSRKYTAFRVDGVLYQFTRPCFGLKNSPAYFNQWMAHVLRDFDGFCKVYVDDIIIYSKSLEEHRQHLHTVFKRLREENVYLSKAKAQLVKTEVQYAGHMISRDGIKPVHDKVAAIMNIPYPTTVKEVRAFLGAINYYRKFIKDINSLTYELTELTKFKGKKVHLSDTCKASIDKIKLELVSDKCLALPDFNLPFHVYVDASDVGTGLMITQKFGADQVEKPILYDSKKFDAAQRNYNTKDRELLAIINCFTKYDYLLKSKPFFLYTDHRNLLYLESSRDISKRSERWCEFMGPFSFKLNHIAGADNVVPDLLSRDRSFYNDWDREFGLEIIKSYEDPFYFKFMDTVRLRNDVTDIDGLLFISNASGDSRRLVVVDPKHVRKILHEAHSTVYAGHPGVKRLHDKVSRHYYFPKFTKSIEKFVQTCVECQKAKADKNKSGYLQSLPIPMRPWIDISMDFLTLPVSVDGYDNLFVVVDRFSKMVKLFPCKKTVKAKEVAKWFCDNVICVFGIPDTIVSDQDPKFTSELWVSTMDALGTSLKMTQPHRAQADGQSEVMNKTIKDIITKMVTKRRRWSSDIALIEAAMNHNVSTSTGFSPSSIVLGYEPRLPFNRNMLALGDYSQDMNYYRNAARDNMIDAQLNQAFFHNRKVAPTSYNIGDEVLIKRSRLNTAEKVIYRNERKLFALFCGPFKITQKISDVNYVIRA